MFQREHQIRAVFWRQRGHAQLHSRQVDPFVFAKRAAVCDFADHFTTVYFFHAQFDQAIGKQDAVAAMNFSRQRREHRVHARRIAQNSCGGNHEALPSA